MIKPIKRFKKSLLITSIGVIVLATFWMVMFSMEIISIYRISGNLLLFLYLIYPCMLFLGSGFGMIAYKSHGKKRLLFTFLQMFIYYCCHYYYGIGDNKSRAEPFSVFALYLVIVLVVITNLYLAPIISRRKAKNRQSK